MKITCAASTAPVQGLIGPLVVITTSCQHSDLRGETVRYYDEKGTQQLIADLTDNLKKARKLNRSMRQ